MDHKQGNLLIIIIVVTVIALLQPIYRLANKIDVITLGLDLKGGVSVLLQAVPPQGQPLKPEDMTGLIEVIRNRVDPQGQRETVITVVGKDRVLVQVPGETKPDEILKLIGQTAMLEFLDVGDKALQEGYDTSKDNFPVILTGRDFANAFPTRDQMGRPAVGFEFKPSAGDIFGRFTQNNVNRYMAIALDKKVISCPVIRSAIWGGKGIIEGGGFGIEQVTLLSNQLKGGALPVPVTVLESRVIGPSLGQDSINHSLIAGVIGFILILVMMIVMYRLPGLVANFALLLYVVLALGYLSLFGVTLTLPGIAGFILSVGMAIDTNIIIYERLKEELSWGKTLIAATEAAFSRAWVAIIDSHMTNILAALVLFMFGTGPVKGFAITLSIGVAISLFSAITVVRFIMGYMVLHFKKTSLYA
jgi:preprotein translocase subunit SecD